MEEKSDEQHVLARDIRNNVSCKIFRGKFSKIFSFSNSLTVHVIILTCQILFNEYNQRAMLTKWPVLLLIVLSTVVIMAVAELCKYQEIKNNKRSQRRARLDFGTKLGMNSPF